MMNTFRTLLTALGGAAFCISTGALAEDQPTAETAVRAALPIDFSANGLSGPGGDVVREGLDNTQFIMIGEAHGHAQTPLLASAFASEAQGYGFTNYAIEVGPFSAKWLREILQRGGETDLAEELTGRPLAIPFLNSVEEARVAMRFAENGEIWGVDQEFIGSPLIHLQILSDMDSQNPELIETLLSAEREAFRTGNQGAVMFATFDAQRWQDLRDAFEGNSDALERIEAMERSQGVYRSFFMGEGLDNNLDRVELIRDNFLRYYHEAAEHGGSPPRVLMKFGATHAGRATSSMSTFDLGSLIEGMAAANGMEALHIAYIPVGGTTLAIRPSPDGAFSERPVVADELRDLLANNGIDLEMIDASDGHFVIDLEAIKRGLGNGGLADLEPMTRFLVLGFDYLITTSKATAMTPLASQ